MFDVVLRGGVIVDGTGSDPYSADIGIRSGRIACIGDLANVDARDSVDVSDRYVTPGFIDLHTHSDFTLIVDSHADSQVHQGVTTEVVGQCGYSCAPVQSTGDIKSLSIGHCEIEHAPDWHSFGDYLDRLDASPLGVNVAAMVGHAALFRSVIGDESRPPRPDEVRQMEKLLSRSLDEGACGFSTGLEYWPGTLCSVEHITPLCRAVSRFDRMYATHIRNRDYYFDVGIAEAIATARQSDIRLQISHIQMKYGAPDYAMDHTLSVIDRARREGVDVSFDVIPHGWSHTSVASILPKWALDGTADDILARLSDAALRPHLKDNPNPIWKLVEDRRWDDIVLLFSKSNADLVGKSLAEIGAIRKTDPYDAALDILLEEGRSLYHVLWTSRSFREADIEASLKDNRCSVISDTLALSPHGALSDHIGSLSGYGWTARFLQHYVKKRKVLSVADAVKRLSALPAAQAGIRDRGQLKAGWHADIAVLDMAGMASRCTVQNPRQYPTGFMHVLVNGRFSLRDGTRTGNNRGRVLRA